VLVPLLPPGRVQSPQGIVPEPAGHSLLLADYVLGLVRVSLDDGTVAPLEGPEGAVLVGADGLCAVPGGDLVAILNGVEPHRAVRLRLMPDRSRVSAIEEIDFNHSAYREPTLCTMVGRDLYYIAASQWSRFSAGATEPREPPVVLTTRLD